jgi:hypothetical protein
MLRGVDCVERSGHHLFGTRAKGFVSQAMLEQFGIRENDSQLIVQAVEQANHFLGHGRIWRPVSGQGSVRRHG